MSRPVYLFFFSLLTAGLVGTAWAQEETDTSEIARLRRQIEAISRQIEAMQLGEEVVAVADTGMYGLGPAASKIYRTARGVSIAGYGEMIYENFAGNRQDGTPSGASDQLDFLRAIVYLGYKFNDRVLFNSEIEFEHGTTDGDAGSVSVEFAYVEYRVWPALNLRAGMMLVPMGVVNELHEPTTFLGTERAETEQLILPSTWRENGIGIFGDVGPVSYRAYLMNGFDGVGDGSSPASGFGAAGLRGGRQKGARTLAEDFAGVVRVDYGGILGLTVGASAYLGGAGQNTPSPSDPSRSIGARTFIAEGHAQFQRLGFDIRGVAALATVDDATAINAARGLTGTESVGDRLVGWYVDAGYDVLRSVQTEQQLLPYVRVEKLNTQSSVPAGFAADPTNDLSIVSVGAAWKPIPNIAVKADYQIRQNEADTGVNQFNMVLAYLF